MGRRALILGGSGQIGRAVAATLLAAGWDVTLASRGAKPLPRNLTDLGARAVVWNSDEAGRLDPALGQGADAVIDLIAYDVRHGRRLLDVQDDVGAFVVVSSASVYRDDQGRTLDEAAQNGFPELPDPIPETHPTVAPGEATYSTRKVALEQVLLDEAVRPVSILRPCAIHGLGSVHPREWWFVKRMLDMRPMIPVAYGGQSRFHTTSVRNIAETTLATLSRPGSRILNVGDPEAHTVTRIGALISERLGYGGQIVPLPEDAPKRVGRTPWSVARPFVLDTRAAEAIGYTPATDYAAEVGGVCEDLIRRAHGADWRTCFPVLAEYPNDHFDYAAEDVFFAGRTMGDH